MVVQPVPPFACHRTRTQSHRQHQEDRTHEHAGPCPQGSSHRVHWFPAAYPAARGQHLRAPSAGAGAVRGATAARSPHSSPVVPAPHLSMSTPGSMSRSSWPAASTAARSSRSASDGRRAMSSAASAAGKMCFSRTSALANLCGAAAAECQGRSPHKVRSAGEGAHTGAGSPRYAAAPDHRKPGGAAHRQARQRRQWLDRSARLQDGPARPSVAPEGCWRAPR